MKPHIKMRLICAESPTRIKPALGKFMSLGMSSFIFMPIGQWTLNVPQEF